MSTSYDLYAINDTYLCTIDYANPPPVLIWHRRCFVQNHKRLSEYREVEYAVLPEVMDAGVEP